MASESSHHLGDIYYINLYIVITSVLIYGHMLPFVFEKRGS